MTFSSPVERLKAWPRVSLLGAPTAIERVERFEKVIGSAYPIFVKRDDSIPFGFGGNKVRKLEVVMADVLSAGGDVVMTCGGVQSNHCRATAAAAARLGLECHLILSGGAPETLTGNTRLDDLFGARLHFVRGREERAGAMTELEARMQREGRHPVVIPLGASTPRGALGFALAVFELTEQGHRPDVIVHASSSGGTQAGLLAGLVLAGLTARVIGVSADESAMTLAATVEELERDALRLVDADGPILRAEVHDRFVGEGYGLPTAASREAQTLLARSEGIVVDHTYTAKALAGLISLVRSGSLEKVASILFWHTGGQVGALA